MRTLSRFKIIGIYSFAECLDYVLILQFLKGTYEFRKVAFRISLYKTQCFFCLLALFVSKKTISGCYS